jgi:hypothetical protein
MTAIVLYPILVVRVPGLGDYLNHLARMHIVSDIDRSEALRGFYQVHWQAMPYLAMDATFVVLNHIATIYAAGRIYIGICIVLPVLSVAVLHLAVHRRLSLVPVAAFLLCYNYLLYFGFLSYLPTLCLAVLVFAGWIASGGWPRWPRAALFGVLALALYLSHLVAFGAYCLTVGAFELARAWRAGFQPSRVIMADWLAAGLQAVPAIVAALSVRLEQPFVGNTITLYLPTKLTALKSPVLFFGGWADAVAFDFALLLLLFCLVTGRLRLAPPVWPAVLTIGAVSICVPSTLWSVWGMDLRLPLLVAMLLLGATSTTERMGRALRFGILGAVVALAAARSVSIAATLRVVDVEIAQVRQVVATMPRGMRLLLVDAARGRLNEDTTLHAGMVAVIDRDAFVPNLFTGTTIVSPVPALRMSSTPQGPPLHMSDLGNGLGRSDDRAGEQAMGGERIYWMGWEDKFDYVLIVHFGVRPAPMPANLRLVTTSSVADLYRIDKVGTP